MITMSKSMSAGAAAGYYQKDSYYTQEGQGIWFGKTADTFGLVSAVSELPWAAARYGLDPSKITPEIEQKLNAFASEEGKLKSEIDKNGITDDIKSKIDSFNLKKEEYNKSLGQIKLVGDNYDNNGILTHRAGFDITLSAPKSLSIMALLGGDERLKDALVEANKEVMEYAEKYFAQGRIWNPELKMQEKVNTENLLVAQYLHSTSRSVDGQTPDPQLHIHNFVSNITLTEQGYKALEPRELYKHQNLLGQIAQNSMAEKVEKLGYQVEWTRQKNGNYTFEIKGVSKDLIDNFSKRTEIIEKAIKNAETESGRILTAAEKDIITKDTKSSKEKQNLDSLKETWTQQAEQLGHTKDSILTETREQIENKKLAATVDEAVNIAHTTLENKYSIFDKYQIIHESAKASQGQFELKELETAIEKSDDIIKLNEKFYTTKNILNAENSIIDTVKSGKNAAEPLLTSKEFLEQTGNSETYKQLTDDQKNALKFILTSTDSFMAIQGDAGSGKTTMFKEFGQVLAEAQALSSDKTEIIAMAPTGKAASVMFKEAGLESQTIDSFLLKPSRNSDDVKKSTLYIVDEASMISTLKLEALLSRAEQENARVVLTGDIKQLPPIEQGSMFAKLQIDQTIPAVEMTQVLRQKTEITQSYAYNFKSGNIEEAFDTLSSQGRIIEHSDKIELRSAIISKAVSDIQEFGLESVAVLSNSNQMKSYINQGIRNELITSGYLENTEALTVKALEAKQLDNFDAKIASNYESGDVMYAYKMQGDIKNGQEVAVIDTNAETNDILISYTNRSGETKEKWIDAENAADAYNVYSAKEKDFVVGDKITFNRNSGDLKNGEQHVILSIDRDEHTITIEKDGEEATINTDEYKNIDHAYATTTHKAQGITADHVHIYAEADNMQNFNSGYVEATRAKEDIHLYVDDKNAVVENYKELADKPNARDIIDTRQDDFGQTKTDQEKQPEMDKTESSSVSDSDQSDERSHNTDEINDEYEAEL